MGIGINKERFAEADYISFKERLREEVSALEQVLARPAFGEGERTIGAELELFLIDPDGHPMCVSHQVLAAAPSPVITPEMGTFEIEVNTPPVTLRGQSFSTLGDHMQTAVDKIRRAAAVLGARVVPIGILPTFEQQDFNAATITDLPRYRAVSAGLRRLRHAPFCIDIDGEDPLTMKSRYGAMESANTSFQVHLRTAPHEFARFFNAAMLMTAPVLAASANSPTFLGHRLWHETRVVLFKQAGDDRTPQAKNGWRPPARVGFGSGWVRDGAAELFMESVALHEPLLPVCGEEDALACVERGGMPELSVLRLHHGTVWKWNRAVYDPIDGGHLRIELRAMPSGPTIDDMLANATFLVGGILALADEMPNLLPSLPFALAKRNFYRAAQYGLNAELAWPMGSHGSPVSVRARDVVLSLVPKVLAGLISAGVDAAEAVRLVDIFQARTRTGITGAVWQLETLAACEASGLPRAAALTEMLERYLTEVQSGQPVHTWSIPDSSRTQ